MSNLEKQFKKFLKKISLSSTQEDSLRRSRDNDQSNITKHFKENLEKAPPTFCMQGSFKMRTIINPLEGEEYDLDDGVYLKHLPDDLSDWESPATLHRWICDALEGITSDGVIDKDTCVRLIYKNNYHIDFPIYGELNGKQYMMHKSKGRIESYPKKLTEWFREKVRDNLRIENLVKYFKAWKDFKQNNIKLPSGMILTILIAENYCQDDDDQYAFLETCNNIYNKLSRPTGFYLFRPVAPYEDLFEGYSDTRKNEFLSKLKSLIDYGEKAVDTDSIVKASEYWQKVFGDRFPKAEEPKQTKAAAIIGSHGKSA